MGINIENITIERVPENQKEILKKLMQLYLYDLSEFSHQDINEQGEYKVENFKKYWIEKEYYHFFIKVSGNIGGFIIIKKIFDLGFNKDTHSMEEFFIMRKYRNMGIGQSTAKKVFTMFEGKWRVRESEKNLLAQDFWKKVISKYTDGNFDEVYQNDDEWKGPVQRFIKYV